jgi:CshA-type fibril repeat protein
LALEARLVFDGAAVATAVEAQNTTNNDGTHAEPVSVAAIAPDVAATVDFLPETAHQAIDLFPKSDATGNQAEFFTAKESVFVPAAMTEPASAIIVVDPRADNAALLYLNPPVNTQVVVLDAARDGFQQIAELLQTRHEVTELHIVPWTQNHQEWLGSQSLTSTLEASVSNSLMDWNDGLSDNAHLVFHGQDSMGAGWLNHLSALTNTQTSWSTESPFNQDNSVPPLTGSSATTLIFIDSAVQNAADIVSAADKNAEIIYLNANSDGLTQIADYLEGRTNIDSIQIISHGKDAALYLGNENIDNSNLASHADQLATIGHALTANGDILLYGCDIAQSAVGEQFVDSIAALTQADVGASTDNTGATSRGGNWTLEYNAGTIEASMLAANDYQGLLAGVVTTVTSVAITSAPILPAGYTTGDVVTATVVFSDIETVTGTPTLMLNVGGQLRAATYSGGSGTNTLTFNYTVVNGDNDANGISIDANSLARNGGTINNIDFAATLYHGLIIDNNLQPVASLADVTVPVLQSAVANGTNLTLTYNEIGSGLLSSGTPLPSNFSVTTNGGAIVPVTAVSVNHVAQSVDLTLGTAITNANNNIRVSYTPSGNAFDIQDSAFNRAASINNAPVTNSMPSFDLKNGSLLFNAPIPIIVNGAAGTGGQSVGDVVIFNNAVTLDGQVIDVVTTTVATTNTTIQGFDTASGFLATTIDNNWFELNSTVVAGGSTTIEFNFIKHGTYTVGTGGVNVLLKNVIVNSYDLDSGQFQEFGGFSSYTVASNTTLVQTNLANNFVHFENVPPTPDSSPLGSPTFDQFRVTALYNEINNFQLKVGSSINTPGYYFLDFSGGPSWNTPISYDIPTVTPLTTGNPSPTLTGTYPPDVRGSIDKAISLFVTVNNKTYTLGNGLSWKPDGTWSLIIPPADALPPGTYEVLVDTGYGNLINAHTRDNTHNELTITSNVAPVNTVPGIKNANAGIPTLISGLSTTDINNNLASTQLSVAGGIINVDLTGGATISTGGNGTNTLTLIGTEAQINAALATVNYIANNGISNDTLTIISTDSAGLTDTDNIVINVNNPPIAVNDNATGVSGTPVTVNVLDNDSDLDGNLDSTSVQIVGAAANGTLTVPNEGIWSVNTSTGAITFTPVAGFIGSPTPINYTVKDTTGLVSTTATVTITVNQVPMNQVPIAVPDNNVATEGGAAVTGDIITNEATLGDQPTLVTAANQNGNTITIGVPFITAARAVLILNADGSYSYTPPANIALNSLTERFNYTITDSNGDTSNSILTIVIQKALGASGSLIQLSNPARAIEEELPKFFTTPPLQPATVLDFSLYTKLYPLPSHDDIISLTGSLRDQVVLELKHFSFDVPSWSFRHTNPNEQLHFEASYPDGSPLPEWLKFNPKLLMFSGIPPKGAHNETVMVTTSDSYGNEVHAVFTVHVNKERASSGNKSLNLDLKLMGIPDKAIEKHQHAEKSATVGKSGLSDRIHAVGKLGKLQESHALLESLKHQ